SEPIDLATLSAGDCTLTRDGVPLPLPGNLSFTSVSGSKYRITGLSAVTASDGLYALTVNAAGIDDPAGNAGNGSASTAWTIDATSPAVTINGSGSQDDPTNESTITFDVVFSEVVVGFNDGSVDLSSSTVGGT